MLEYLRNASEKPIAKILIAILAFSFIGWGVAEWIFGGAVTDTTLVRVGSAKISAQQFSNAKSQELSSMTREQQREIYTDAVQMQKLTDKVLQDLAIQEMAGSRAKDLGLVVSEHKIAEQIKSMPEFQQAGEFSEQMFDSVLAASGLNEDGFAAVLRNQLTREMILGPVAANLDVPKFVVSASYNARNATRDIEYVTVDFGEFDVGTPTDEQLRTFYAQNPQTVAEVRNVSYVLVPAKMDSPDSYDAGFATAQQVEDDIISGEAMTDAAKRHDAQFVNVGKLQLGSQAFDEIMDEAMIARMFTMEDGTESELLETKSGFVIARVDSVVPEHTADFDAVRDSLENEWRRAEQKKQAYVRANEILVDLNQGKGLAENKQTATVSRTTGAPIDVLSAAFNKGLNTNTLVESVDAFYVLHIGDEKMPIADESKISDLKTELQTQMAGEIADDYNAFLKRQYPIKVNEKVYNRYIAK